MDFRKIVDSNIEGLKSSVNTELRGAQSSISSNIYGGISSMGDIMSMGTEQMLKPLTTATDTLKNNIFIIGGLVVIIILINKRT